MLAKYHGGEMVEDGIYLGVTNGEFVNTTERGGRLPGTYDARYIRVNPALALLIGPFVGLAFVIVLPVLVPIYVGYLLVRKAGQAMRAVSREEARKPVIR